MIIISICKCENDPSSRHNKAYELLDILAQKYLKIDNFSLKIKRTDSKKPFVEGYPFSISHSADLVAVAISSADCDASVNGLEELNIIKLDADASELGLDIEALGEKSEQKLRKIAYTKFFDNELNLLSTYQGVEYIRQFCVLWTQKEAYGKFTSVGMRDSLSFDTTSDRDDISLFTTPITQDDREYVLSLCHNSNFEK